MCKRPMVLNLRPQLNRDSNDVRPLSIKYAYTIVETTVDEKRATDTLLLYHSTNNTVHSKAQYVDVVASHCPEHEANVSFVKAKRDRKLLYFEEDTAVTALLPRTLHIICRFLIKHSFDSTKIQYTCVLDHRR